MNRSLSSFLERFKQDPEDSDNGSANSAGDRLYDEEHTMGRAAERLDQQIVSFFGDDFDDNGGQFNLEDQANLDHVMSSSSHAEGESGASPTSKALSALSVLYGEDGFPVVSEQRPPNLDAERNNSSLARFLRRAQSDVAETKGPRSRSHSRSLTRTRRDSRDVDMPDNTKDQEDQKLVEKKKTSTRSAKKPSSTQGSPKTSNQTTGLQVGFPAEDDLPDLAVKIASFDFVVEATSSTVNDEDEEVPSSDHFAFSQTRQGSLSPTSRRDRARSGAVSTPRPVPRSAPRSGSRSTPRCGSRTTPRSVPRSTPRSGREIASYPSPAASPTPKIKIPRAPIAVVRSNTADHKSKRGSTPSTSKRTSTQKHIRWCGHGVRWTALALLAAIVGSVFAILSQRSTAFVRLATPMTVAPIYEEVDTIGMFRMEVCFNETFSAQDQTGCQIFPLTSRDISDNMFDLSRIFLTLATLFGCFFTLFLISAVFWESINLKPIGLGFLSIYFFQSFSMLFFDTELCSGHTCKLGPGCAFCICASLCWIVACVSVAKMDNFKIRANRRRRRAARRARREERRRRCKELEHKQKSLAPLTTRTVATLSTASTDESSRTTPTSDYDMMTPRGMHRTDTGSVYEC